MVVLALGMVAGSLAALVWGFRSGDLWAVGAGGFGASASLLLMALWWKSLVDDFRNPTSYGGGWEWFCGAAFPSGRADFFGPVGRRR